VPFVDGPDGPIEVLVTGRGEPVTLFAHGLAASIGRTRPFASGVAGTRVFLHFRGHGATASPAGRWTYGDLAAELTAVADRYGASRALGVSMGAGALLRTAVSAPRSFERLVLVLPSAIDRPRDDEIVRSMAAMADAVDREDEQEFAAALLAQLPTGARGREDVSQWALHQARLLSGSRVSQALRELPAEQPLDRHPDLSHIQCPVLVIGQEGDEAHPAAVARELTDRLPNSVLRVFDDGGLLWAHRAELRTLISSFLNPS
jgi:pimeloyl-ACP methyl ester carboxylesterase